MRYLLTFLLPFFTLNIASAQQNDAACKDLDALLAREQHAHEALVNFRASPYTNNYDLKYHRLEWTLDPAVTYIAGTVTSYFEPTEAGFQEINFDLADALAVFSVTYHGQPLAFTQHPERLQILLPGPIPEGQLDSLSVTYAGAPVATGFGSFNRSTHNGTPVLWTLSEPYGARDWWPCKLDLNDKIDSIDVIVRTPGQYRAASNGLLVDERTDGNQKVYHWRHRYPIATYLIAVAVTNYAVYSDFVPVPGGPDIEVLNYVYPEQLAAIQDQTQATVDVMQLFNDLFGLYPFAGEKYGHAQFSWGGGMEHQTMSFMGGWSHLLQAHELAHQWFGNKITCGSWEDIWLNEGFATYLEGLTYEHGLGPNTWQGWLQGKINDVTQWPHGSVWVEDTTDVSRIFRYRLTYAKSALLLHMLRWQLGDADFFQAVRNYLDDPDLAFGYARTADLKGHLEAQSGQNLDEFFADWFYGQGFPSYHFTWWQEGEEVRLMAEQTQSHHTVDFFEMPIPLTFYGAGQDTTLVFDHAFSGQTFTVDLPFEVTSIEFNRDRWILYDEVTYEEAFFTAAAEALTGDGLRLFPNPASDYVTLEVTDPALRDARVQLFDGRGRLLSQARLNGNRLEIDLSGLAAGMYWVKVVTPGKEWMGKVVREL